MVNDTTAPANGLTVSDAAFENGRAQGRRESSRHVATAIAEHYVCELARKMVPEATTINVRFDSSDFGERMHVRVEIGGKVCGFCEAYHSLDIERCVDPDLFRTINARLEHRFREIARALKLAKCSQADCQESAAFSYHWPGKGELGVCERHAPQVASVSNALGMALQLTPLEKMP